MSQMPQQQNGGGYASGYLDEWRADVNEQLDKRAANEQRTAVILERLTNRLDEHDKRLARLEDEPRQRRSEAITRRGLSLQEVYLALVGVSLLISLLAPHLSWR